MNLLALYPCPACEGKGRRLDNETGGTKPCLVCEASGSVDYNPADLSVFPYGGPQ